MGRPITSALPVLLDQSAFQQRLHDAVHRHAADLLDLRPRQRLAVSDDGQGFQGRLGEARRARLGADQRDDPGGEFRLADELPCAGHAGQSVTALRRLVVLLQLFQRRHDVAPP